MSYRSRIIFFALVLGAVSPVVSASAKPKAPDGYTVIQSSAFLRSAGKCARSRICRKLFKELATRIAIRVVELMTDLATGTAEQIYELLGKILNAPDSPEVLAKLGKLEALLKENGVRCAELQRDIEAIRALHH